MVMVWRTSILLAVLAACSPSDKGPELPRSADADAQSAPRASGEPDAHASDAVDAGAKVADAKPSEKGQTLAEFLKEHLPKGGELDADGKSVKHKVAAGQTAAVLAKLYFPISSAYQEPEFAIAIAKANPKGLTPGQLAVIPKIVERPIGDPKKDRLPLPDDRSMRGVFVTGAYAGIRWIDTLDKSRARGFTAVVLDGKDYMGGVNYPSKAKIAVETNASKNLLIPDLPRAIRVAHDRGIRVIMRIPCFHDPWAQDHAIRLAIQGTWGGPFKMGWMDPMNKEAQDYILELVQEQIDAGADEVQLDYIRFPVHPGTEKAVLPDRHGPERQKKIRDFVKRVHEVTQAGGIPLSLDLFGVTATGVQSDMEALGQDITMLAPECEAISPMLYPSHYSKGFMGHEHPGDHAEIHGYGTKKAVERLPKGSTTVIRSWLQAFPQDAPHYGAAYVFKAADTSEKAGGVGWLMWSPGCEYSAVWNGFPIKNPPSSTATPSASTPAPSAPAKPKTPSKAK